MPNNIIRRAKQLRAKAIMASGSLLGLNVARTKDYYSTLPVNSQLKRTISRWFRPSELSGVAYDIDEMKRTFGGLHHAWSNDFRENAGDYTKNIAAGFGPGYPALDARTLYYMVRALKPKRYLEVGSGLSTFYASIAGGQNKRDGKPLSITCIEPFPYDALRSIENITLIQKVAQDVPLAEFEKLESGDMLKIDSDVAYLILEVLPRIAKGVCVHIHDVPFPYNVPFPPSRWIFGKDWPVYWNEAMIVQSFLAFNGAFEVLLSTPMIRHADEGFLLSLVPDATPVAADDNPYSSLWLRRVS
jgi:Methyltransferase domain